MARASDLRLNFESQRAETVRLCASLVLSQRLSFISVSSDAPRHVISVISWILTRWERAPERRDPTNSQRRYEVRRQPTFKSTLSTHSYCLCRLDCWDSAGSPTVAEGATGITSLICRAPMPRDFQQQVSATGGSVAVQRSRTSRSRHSTAPAICSRRLSNRSRGMLAGVCDRECIRAVAILAKSISCGAL